MKPLSYKYTPLSGSDPANVFCFSFTIHNSPFTIKYAIGGGRNLEDKGITEEEAVMLLENDIQECLKDLETIFQAFDQLPESVQQVLVDMRFNLGSKGFRSFTKMIKAVKNLKPNIYHENHPQH